jgi:hypothetical protein
MLPTAQASTNYDYDATMTLDQLDAVAIQADDSGGSLLVENSVAETAKHDNAPLIDEFAAWRPGKFLRQRRANARASGGWYLGQAFRRSGSC